MLAVLEMFLFSHEITLWKENRTVWICWNVCSLNATLIAVAHKLIAYMMHIYVLWEKTRNICH